MKTIFLSLITLLVFSSCSNEELANEETEEVSTNQKNDEKATGELEESTEEKTTEFHLISPDTAKLKEKWQEANFSSSLGYFYLQEYYKSQSEKESVKYYGYDSETLCSFTQSFEGGLTYKLDDCSEDGGGTETISFPKQDIETVHNLIETLFFDPANQWWSEYSYEPEDAGCFYNIKESENETIISIYCGC